MSAIADLANEIWQHTAKSDKKDRAAIQVMIESQLVEFRPDYMDAAELLASLEVGLALRVSPRGDDLPLEIQHAFDDLKKLLESA